MKRTPTTEGSVSRLQRVRRWTSLFAGGGLLMGMFKTPHVELERRLFEACLRQGRQTDDQTVLIVRVGREAA